MLKAGFGNLDRKMCGCCGPCKGCHGILDSQSGKNLIILNRILYLAGVDLGEGATG